MSTILVVDDDARIRNLLYLLFRDAGHSVTAVESGRMAVQVGATGTYDAALVDLQMPDMDGFATITALRAMTPELPIVAMSGGGPAFLDAARDHGADAALAKPFRIEQALDAVQGAIGRGAAKAGVF